MSIESLGRLQPEASAALERMNNIAWAAADPELLELCRCLIVTMLEARSGEQDTGASVPGLSADKTAAIANWRTSDAFSPLERAALDFTEQFVISVSSVTDEQVEALRSILGDEKTYAFAAAIYVVEMTERLHIVAGAVLENGSKG